MEKEREKEEGKGRGEREDGGGREKQKQKATFLQKHQVHRLKKLKIACFSSYMEARPVS
jgi:hypothetical protein